MLPQITRCILGGHPNLNDLEDIDPELKHSLDWIKSNDPTDLEQPFSYELDVLGIRVSQELKEDGSNTVVDETNKNSYIKKLYLAKTQGEVLKQIESFKKGFFEIIPEDFVKLFSSAELGILISGKSEIDIQDLMKHTTYQDINRNSNQVKWFWEIIGLMDQNMLANLLFFITGISF